VTLRVILESGFSSPSYFSTVLELGTHPSSEIVAQALAFEEFLDASGTALGARIRENEPTGPPVGDRATSIDIRSRTCASAWSGRAGRSRFDEADSVSDAARNAIRRRWRAAARLDSLLRIEPTWVAEIA